MDELKSYVDHLFSKYGKSHKIEELKDEILGNLEAKKMDLIKNGSDEKTAIKIAKDSIKSVDCLIDGNINIYINKFKLECIQQALLYIVIAWVITIPLTIFQKYMLINSMLFIFMAAAGILYIYKNSDKNVENIEKRQFVNLNYYLNLKKRVWIIWSIFIVLCIFMITGIYFGSNIWFGRPVHIDGPYMFGTIVLSYITPLISVIIPAVVNSYPELVLKYEAGEHDEK